MLAKTSLFHLKQSDCNHVKLIPPHGNRTAEQQHSISFGRGEQLPARNIKKAMCYFDWIVLLPEPINNIGNSELDVSEIAHIRSNKPYRSL